MKLTVKHVYEATLTLTNIINDRRRFPQKGHYRIARMHSKLQPEFDIINGRREALIKAYDSPVMVSPPEGLALSTDDLIPSGNYQVPADKMGEFTKAWDEIGNEEIEVGVEPIPLSTLDLGDGSDGAIQATELITLGDLVTE